MNFQARLLHFFKEYGFKTSFLILLVLLSRLIAMYWIPLNDSTEARYAEIARLMLTSHNWISLMHYPGEYFWAKPPLSTWLSATSMQVFGINPFSARLPAWILSLISLGLVAKLAQTQLGKNAAFWSVAVLSTCIYFLVDAGTVMTDPALMTCVVTVMVSFWMAMHGHHRIWSYLIFIAWGLGLLVKGLVTGLFTVLPLMAWLFITKEWKKCWRNLPWIKGSFLTLLIAVPWYILAEQRTPGFLSYFFIGEHFMRYLKPGWSGDLYGFAHQAPYGMIWVYFILGVMPWSMVAVIWAFSKKTIWKVPTKEKTWNAYLLCFMLVPLLVFTFASNIIYPYVFPCMPAFALWFTTLLMKTDIDTQFRNFFNSVAIFMIAAVLIVTGLFLKYPIQVSKSNDLMISAWKEDRQSDNEGLIYSMLQPEYSTMFYSSGEVKATRDEVELCNWLRQGTQYVVLNSDEPSQYDEFIEKTYQKVFVQQHRNRIDTLYRVDSLPLFCKVDE
jgi:4-amino-4-deoxy-L-arabinose transferase-like glycosyltransferase